MQADDVDKLILSTAVIIIVTLRISRTAVSIVSHVACCGEHRGAQAPWRQP